MYEMNVWEYFHCINNALFFSFLILNKCSEYDLLNVCAPLCCYHDSNSLNNNHIYKYTVY